MNRQPSNSRRQGRFQFQEEPVGTRQQRMNRRNQANMPLGQQQQASYRPNLRTQKREEAGPSILGRAKDLFSAIPEAFRGVKDAVFGSQIEQDPEIQAVEEARRERPYRQDKLKQEKEEAKHQFASSGDLADVSFGQPKKRNLEVNRRLSFGKEAKAHSQTLLEERNLQKLYQQSFEEKVDDYLKKQQTNSPSSSAIRINSFMQEWSREQSMRNLPHNIKIAHIIGVQVKKKRELQKRLGNTSFNSLLTQRQQKLIIKPQPIKGEPFMLEVKRVIKPILTEAEDILNVDRRACRRLNEQNCFPGVEKIRNIQRQNLPSSYQLQKSLIRKLITEQDIDLGQNGRISIDQLDQLAQKLLKKERNLTATKKRSPQQQIEIDKLALTQQDARLEQAYRALQEKQSKDEMTLQKRENKQLELKNKEIYKELLEMKDEFRKKERREQEEKENFERKFKQYEQKIEQKEKQEEKMKQDLKSQIEFAQKAQESKEILYKETLEYQNKIKELEKQLAEQMLQSQSQQIKIEQNTKEISPSSVLSSGGDSKPSQISFGLSPVSEKLEQKEQKKEAKQEETKIEEKKNADNQLVIKNKDQPQGNSLLKPFEIPKVSMNLSNTPLSITQNKAVPQISTNPFLNKTSSDGGGGGLQLPKMGSGNQPSSNPTLSIPNQRNQPTQLPQLDIIANTSNSIPPLQTNPFANFGKQKNTTGTSSNLNFGAQKNDNQNQFNINQPTQTQNFGGQQQQNKTAFDLGGQNKSICFNLGGSSSDQASGAMFSITNQNQNLVGGGGGFSLGNAGKNKKEEIIEKYKKKMDGYDFNDPSLPLKYQRIKDQMLKEVAKMN